MRGGAGWDLAWRRSGDRRSEVLSVDIPADLPGDGSDGDSSETYERSSILLGDASLLGNSSPNDPRPGTEDGPPEDRLVLAPVAADRPVVTRPRDGCVVLPGRTVTLYVSTPLWLRVESPDGETLLEEPTVRLSDTWFGASTRAGEFCYAIQTRAFPNLEELPILAFRAITRVRIENTSHGELELSRLSLPAPSLSIWLDADRPERGLWTSYVVLRRSSDGETAELDVVRGAPPDLSQPERVAWPRQRQSRNVVVRAMSAILGQGA